LQFMRNFNLNSMNNYESTLFWGS